MILIRVKKLINCLCDSYRKHYIRVYNRMPMRGRGKGFYSMRINDPWRVVFRFAHGAGYAVAVVDDH